MEERCTGGVDKANVQTGGAYCGRATWEVLRGILNPGPSYSEEAITIPVVEEFVPLVLPSDEGLFIMNLITSTMIEVKYRPQEIQDISITTEDETPRGRSVGYVGYTSTENKVVSFTIPLSVDYLDGQTLESVVNKYKALEYPNYQPGIVIPPQCYVNMYRGIRFTAVCTNCEVVWKGDIKNKAYSEADVSLTFRNTSEIPYSAERQVVTMDRGLIESSISRYNKTSRSEGSYFRRSFLLLDPIVQT